MNNTNEITRARGYYYEFFATPFFYEEKDSKFKIWKKQLEVLAANPLNDACAAAFEALKGFDFESFKREQNNVMFDFSYANIPLTVSFYEEGRDDGAARLRVIGILKRNLYVKDNIKCEESEDYVGFVFAMMAKFLEEEADGKSSEDAASTELFSRVINGFIDEFMQMCDEHEKSNFMLHLMTIMRSFIELERSYLNISAPVFDPSVQTPAQMALDRKPFQSKMPTAKPKIAAEEFSLAEK